MSKAGFPKIKMNGRGISKPPKSKLLDRNCVPGDIVHWSTDKEFIGELIEWDSNVAIVNIGSMSMAVEC
jgi:hypothetical protein